MQAANFGAAYRQPGAAVTAAGVVTPGGYPPANRRFPGPGLAPGPVGKGPALRRFAKGDLQASASSSLGSFGSTDSPALRALALLGFLFFLQQIQTLLNQTGRKKRSVSPCAGRPDCPDEENIDEDLANLDLSTWMRRATKAAVPVAVAYFVEPRSGEENTCIQRIVCEANAQLRKRPDVRSVAASLLLTHGTNELLSTSPIEQEANLRAASAGSHAGNCTKVATRCTDVEFNEISRVSDKLYHFAGNLLPTYGS